MDTKLKKSKMIKHFFFRIIAAGTLFAALTTAILGREALGNLYKEGFDTLSGSIYSITEFKEYVAYIYTQGILGYGGIGDIDGNPLQDDWALQLSQEAKEDFHNELRYAGNNLLYYVEYDGQVVERNIPYPVFSENSPHLSLPDNMKLCCYWNGESEHMRFFNTQYSGNWQSPFLTDYYEQEYHSVTDQVDNLKLLIVLEESAQYDSVSSPYLYWMSYRASSYRNLLLSLFACTFVAISALLCSLFTAKNSKKVKTAYQQAISKVPLEIRLLVTGVVIYLCAYHGLWNFIGPSTHRFTASGNWGFYIAAGMALYLFYLDFCGNWFDFPKQTLLYRIYSYFRKYQASLPWHKKALNMYHITLVNALTLLITGTVLLCLKLGTALGLFYPNSFHTVWLRTQAIYIIIPAFLLGLPLFLAGIRLKGFIRDVSSIHDTLSHIRSGIESPPLEANQHSLLQQTMEDLNDVNNGIQTAVEQKNLSNKMRVELITNVSHDLKTPLTSIINYAELLCEEDLPAPSSEYADALRTKAYRLKSMVQDVFDLSKATSGNLHIEMTKLDLAKLIRQTLADMDEQITASTLTCKLNISTEPLFIEADGEKLYRVFQNLLNNALQYSLENSRVHIQLEKQGNIACARIKNTSRQELNFSAEEIMERFVRADSSRTTEGSGLGLSIVRSFTEACGGSFTIEMDADLFCACVTFPLAEQTPIKHSESF